MPKKVQKGVEEAIFVVEQLTSWIEHV